MFSDLPLCLSFRPEMAESMVSLPLDSVQLLDLGTGREVEAAIVELTRWDAFFHIHRRWWRFSDHGPHARSEVYREPGDQHWRWVSFVRRLRKNPLCLRAAVPTPDRHIQGAIIYRLDGASYLEPGKPTIFVEYLAAAPRNRADFVASPRYKGVGSALLVTAVLPSNDYGYGGRVSLFSLAESEGFYKRHRFVETGDRKDRMMHYELTEQAAQELLREKGLH